MPRLFATPLPARAETFMSKRARSDGSSEASFSDNESSSSDASVESDSSAGENACVRDVGSRVTVSQRLKRIKTLYPTDCERSLDWTLQRVSEAEARLRTAQQELVGFTQPRDLLCTLHDYQLDGVRWCCALWKARLNGVLADESVQCARERSTCLNGTRRSSDLLCAWRCVTQWDSARPHKRSQRLHF